MCKKIIETDSGIHKRIHKSRVWGNNKKVSSSSICKYNLLRKADTLLESLYRPGKVGRLLRVQELRCRKCIYPEKSKCITRKERPKHDVFCSADKGQIPRLKILGN